MKTKEDDERMDRLVAQLAQDAAIQASMFRSFVMLLRDKGIVTNAELADWLGDGFDLEWHVAEEGRRDKSDTDWNLSRDAFNLLYNLIPPRQNDT